MLVSILVNMTLIVIHSSCCMTFWCISWKMMDCGTALTEKEKEQNDSLKSDYQGEFKNHSLQIYGAVRCSKAPNRFRRKKRYYMKRNER